MRTPPNHSTTRPGTSPGPCSASRTRCASWRLRSFGVLLAALLAVMAAPGSARANTTEIFTEATQALARGAPTEAIDRLELLADRGFVHPDASFNRGLAYLARARSSGARPGDHGRAVASFREALLLRPDDASARRLLDDVRQELARKQARSGSSQHVETPIPSRALVGLLHENTWAALALMFSATTAVGFGLRLRRRTQSPWSSGALAGAILVGVGVLGLGVTGTATAIAQSLRKNTQLAVVVAPDARLLDERGRPLDRPPLLEGTEIHLTTLDGPLARIERSADEVWVRRSDIRTLVGSVAP
jgi:hypothetical protein